MTDEMAPVYVMANYMNTQPKYCVFNFDQSIAIIGSFMDVLYLDIANETELDIDAHF